MPVAAYVAGLLTSLMNNYCKVYMLCLLFVLFMLCYVMLPVAAKQVNDMLFFMLLMYIEYVESPCMLKSLLFCMKVEFV